MEPPEQVHLWDDDGIVAAEGFVMLALGDNELDEQIWPRSLSWATAIVEREDLLRVFSDDLPASVTSVTIPSEFLESSTEYLFDLQAI